MLVTRIVTRVLVTRVSQLTLRKCPRGALCVQENYARSSLWLAVPPILDFINIFYCSFCKETLKYWHFQICDQKLNLHTFYNA